MRQNDALVLRMLWLLRWLRLWRLLRLLLLSLLSCMSLCCCLFRRLLLRVDRLLNHDFVLEENLRMLRGRDRVGTTEQELTGK